jgi:hypothetical protein
MRRAVGVGALRSALEVRRSGLTIPAVILCLLPGFIAVPDAQPGSREAAARAPIEAFFKAFNARDNDALKRTLHYSHVRINEQGGVNIWQTAADAATNFDALIRTEGWARSTLDSVTLRANDPVKAHFEVVFSRYKADGTKYATYQSLWIVTLKDAVWGVQARSSFAP